MLKLLKTIGLIIATAIVIIGISESFFDSGDYLFNRNILKESISEDTEFKKHKLNTLCDSLNVHDQIIVNTKTIYKVVIKNIFANGRVHLELWSHDGRKSVKYLSCTEAYNLITLYSQ
jgi:hypothetical protein